MSEPREEASTDLEHTLAAYLAAQRMTRRQLLERIAAVGAAAALAPVIAACSAPPAADGGQAAAAHRSRMAAEPEATPVVPAAPVQATAPVQAAAASSHVIARIIARIMPRG
jgi:hypothetical protein